MSSRRQASPDAAELDLFPDLERAPRPAGPADEDADFWLRCVRAALAQRSSRSMAIAEQGLQAWPVDPELLLLGALTARPPDNRAARWLC